MINWRSLLDDYNISWRDRGKNTSKNNILIHCCWCGSEDPSEHLAINEIKDVYFCLRNSEHSGKSLTKLLVALGISYADVPYIINRYNTEVIPEEEPKKPASSAERSWSKFLPASQSKRCCEYLRSRWFLSPVSVCNQYDLRFSPEGKWAARLLFPVRHNGVVVSWTGRAIISDLTPKYLTEDTDIKTFYYLPRKVRDTLLIVEGPMDALKIAVATDNQPISALALMGKSYFNKLDEISDLAQSCKKILICLDEDVPISISYKVVYELSARVNATVQILNVPYGESDPGAMSVESIRDWIRY